MMLWKPFKHGWRLRTDLYTLSTRPIKDIWHWTVHEKCIGRSLKAHGKATTPDSAQLAAQEALASLHMQASNLPDKPVLPSIYFVGADSTGKSELCKVVAAAYNLPRCYEGARAVLHEEGYSLASLRVSSKTADAYQRAVFNRQLVLEANTPKPFVADRGLLDNLTYAALHARCFSELINRPEVLPYIEKQRNDIVFLVRPQKGLRKRDGVRVLPTWEMQQRIDFGIELLLKQFDVPYVTIEMASAAAREDFVDYVLKARGHVKK